MFTASPDQVWHPVGHDPGTRHVQAQLRHLGAHHGWPELGSQEVFNVTICINRTLNFCSVSDT